MSGPDLQHPAEGGDARQQVAAPLHELRPHRDGGDGLLHGEVSGLWQDSARKTQETQGEIQKIQTIVGEKI